MAVKNQKFGQLFKKYRLKAGFATLRELGDYLASRGIIYDESLFSRWQNGERVPKDRRLLLNLIDIFIQNEAISDKEEANLFLALANQRDLDEEELIMFSNKLQNKVLINIPEEPSLFIGREKYLREISWHLLNKNPVLIYGVAGIGKTALAIKIAHLIKNRFYDGVLWYPYNIKEPENILNNIAITFGEDIFRIKNKEVKSKIVKELLKKKEVILILDNVENFAEFDLFLPTQKEKFALLATSKYRFEKDKKLKLVKLEGFETEEFLSLAKIVLGNPFVVLNRKLLIELGKKIGYSPLAAAILIKRINQDPSLLKSYLTHFDKETNNIYKIDYDNKNLYTSLNLSFVKLSEEIKKTFISLSVFKGNDFSTEAVAFINKITPIEAEKRIINLKDFSFIEKVRENRWRIHLLIKIFIKNKFNDNTLYQRLAWYFIDFLKKLGWANYNQYKRIEEEIDNISDCLIRCYQFKYYRELISLWEYLGVFWWEIGSWKEVEKYGKLILSVAKKLNDRYLQAKILIRELAWLFYWKGELKKAEALMKKGKTLINQLKDKELQALALIRQGKIYQSKDQPLKALSCFKNAYLFYKRKNDIQKKGDILTYIGETYWLMGENNKAKNYLKKALKIVENIKDFLQKTTILSRLGCIFLKERNFKKATSYFKESLLLRRRMIQRESDDFWNHLGLGILYQMRGKINISKKNFFLAKKEMIRGGYTKKILTVDIFPIIFKKEIKESNFFNF